MDGFYNKFLFVSFQGKSHDKEVNVDEKKKLAKMTVALEEEEKMGVDTTSVRRGSEIY